MQLEDVAARLSIAAVNEADATDGWSRAAVCAVLRSDPEPELLFIRRAEHPSDPWSGHMAFPGGRVDPGDVSLQAAAEREALEEVGLDLPVHARLLGRLDEVPTYPDVKRTRLVISPFVYALHTVPELVLDRSEVASVHWLPLAQLLSGAGRGVFPFEYGGTSLQMPMIAVGESRIWGLTLRMLDDMLERLGSTPAAS